MDNIVTLAELLVSGAMLGIAFCAGFALALLITMAERALAWAWKRRMKKDKGI